MIRDGFQGAGTASGREGGRRSASAGPDRVPPPPAGALVQSALTSARPLRPPAATRKERPRRGLRRGDGTGRAAPDSEPFGCACHVIGVAARPTRRLRGGEADAWRLNRCQCVVRPMRDGAADAARRLSGATDSQFPMGFRGAADARRRQVRCRAVARLLYGGMASADAARKAGTRAMAVLRCGATASRPVCDGYTAESVRTAIAGRLRGRCEPRRPRSDPQKHNKLKLRPKIQCTNVLQLLTFCNALVVDTLVAD